MNIKKVICFFNGHKRGKTTCKPFGNQFYWKVNCVRCDKKISYLSPRLRLVGTEMAHGFDGN